MSGHSKWATIKRQKDIKDSKRGALFTRIGNQIAMAARSGTDPMTNPSLAAVIEKAKSANMPMSNIERAIKRVADKDAAQLEEVLYEGYGDPKYRPCPLLRRMVQAKLYGRKSGRGFYDYSAK